MQNLSRLTVSRSAKLLSPGEEEEPPIDFDTLPFARRYQIPRDILAFLSAPADAILENAMWRTRVTESESMRAERIRRAKERRALGREEHDAKRVGTGRL